jgi:putative hydrolase of HD superfamily
MAGVLEFLRAAERLKTTTRSAWTSAGQSESVAEHTWRLCLMAIVLAPEVPGIDVARLLKICVIHDLGEAIGGDVPALNRPVEQQQAPDRKGCRRTTRPDEAPRPLPEEPRSRSARCG